MQQQVHRGPGLMAASFSKNSMGSKRTLDVPSRQDG
jgi:hypothetical protein